MKTQTYRFGPYRLDLSRRLLIRDGSVRQLGEKTFQILCLLLEADCAVVERRVFFERLWPNEPVTDGTLRQHIFALRRALGELGTGRSYVLSVPRKGYRFATRLGPRDGLAMKAHCERCACTLDPAGEAYICSYECTFCAECSGSSLGRCPNCGGEQLRRPRRREPWLRG